MHCGGLGAYRTPFLTPIYTNCLWLWNWRELLVHFINVTNILAGFNSLMLIYIEHKCCIHIHFSAYSFSFSSGRIYYILENHLPFTSNPTKMNASKASSMKPKPPTIPDPILLCTPPQVCTQPRRQVQASNVATNLAFTDASSLDDNIQFWKKQTEALRDEIAKQERAIKLFTEGLGEAKLKASTNLRKYNRIKRRVRVASRRAVAELNTSPHKDRLWSSHFTRGVEMFRQFAMLVVPDERWDKITEEEVNNFIINQRPWNWNYARTHMQTTLTLFWLWRAASLSKVIGVPHFVFPDLIWTSMHHFSNFLHLARRSRKTLSEVFCSLLKWFGMVNVEQWSSSAIMNLHDDHLCL